jgi:hypothetical protein
VIGPKRNARGFQARRSKCVGWRACSRWRPLLFFESHLTFNSMMSKLSLSLPRLGDLCVSAVNNRFKYTHRRDAERAEEAQRT